MLSLCRVTFISTPEDQSVHIEESGNPDNLLYIAEDERVGPVFHHAWGFIRNHPTDCIDVRFGHAMTYRRRNQVMSWLDWLLRRILNGR